MKVLKFGGTSVANSESISKVISILNSNRNDNLVIVVSALGGITNLLQECLSLKGKSIENVLNEIEERHLEVINNLSNLDGQSSLKSFLKENLNQLEDILDAISTIDEVTKKTVSKVLTLGELLSSKIIYEILVQKGFDIKYVNSKDLIFTKEVNENEVLDGDKSCINIKNNLDLSNLKMIIAPGFICSDESGEISNLGRGGSDTSAVALAAAFCAERCDIYTDVDGVYTADPRIVSNALKLETITYEEMLELASQGAKVLQTRSVALAMNYNVKLQVLSSFENKSGTFIINERQKSMEDTIISGITYTSNEAKITLFNVIDKPGQAAMIFGALADHGINVDMIVQTSTKDGEATDITFTVLKSDLLNTKEIVENLKSTIKFKNMVEDSKVSKVSVVGNGMRTKPGVAKTMFKTLADNNINIQVISTSEIKISVLISSDYTELAIRTLHDAFGLGKDIKTINID